MADELKGVGQVLGGVARPHEGVVRGDVDDDFSAAMKLPSTVHPFIQEFVERESRPRLHMGALPVTSPNEALRPQAQTQTRGHRAGAGSGAQTFGPATVGGMTAEQALLASGDPIAHQYQNLGRPTPGAEMIALTSPLHLQGDWANRWGHCYLSARISDATQAAFGWSPVGGALAGLAVFGAKEFFVDLHPSASDFCAADLELVRHGKPSTGEGRLNATVMGDGGFMIDYKREF